MKIISFFFQVSNLRPVEHTRHWIIFPPGEIVRVDRPSDNSNGDLHYSTSGIGSTTQHRRLSWYVFYVLFYGVKREALVQRKSNEPKTSLPLAHNFFGFLRFENNCIQTIRVTFFRKCVFPYKIADAGHQNQKHVAWPVIAEQSAVLLNVVKQVPPYTTPSHYRFEKFNLVLLCPRTW